MPFAFRKEEVSCRLLDRRQARDTGGELLFALRLDLSERAAAGWGESDVCTPPAVSTCTRAGVPGLELKLRP